MSQQSEETTADEWPDEATVADYLRAHPEFFQRQRELVEHLSIPHDVDPAVSLVAYQVRVLREEKHAVRRRLDDLLRVARDNDRLTEQFHRLTLELIDAPGLAAAVAIVSDALRSGFQADAVCLRLIGRDLAGTGFDVIDPEGDVAERLGERFPAGRPVMGRLSGEQMALAFGETPDLATAAVLPLDDGPVRGVLAIGSRDGERYRGDQGTVFLNRLAELVARVLRRAMETENG